MLKSQNAIIKIISHIALSLFSALCLIPFFTVLSISLTPEYIIVQDGFSIFPKAISFEAYDMLFKNPATISRAYIVTTFVTVAGTVLSLLVSTQFAYTLSRKDFILRKPMSFFLFFTMLFNGGLVPTYILITKYLMLKNTLWAIILPSLAGAWNIFLLKSFLMSVSMSIIEAAKIDGASEYYIFYRIVVPITSGGIATVGIFVALAFWNEWYANMLYINNPKLYSLQYLLQNLLSKIEILKIADSTGGMSSAIDLPKHSLRMATCVTAMGPIIFTFLLFQKYFVSGITVGSIKE